MRQSEHEERSQTVLKLPKFTQAAMIHTGTVLYLHADMNTALLQLALEAQSYGIQLLPILHFPHVLMGKEQKVTNALL